MALYFRGASNTLASYYSEIPAMIDGVTMNTRLLLATTAVLCATALPVRADIYKCTGSDGHVTYSNMGDKNCKRLSLDPSPAPAPAARSAAKTPSPVGFPKVEEGAQKARDNDRRKILESELAAERKNLEQARKDLAEQSESALPEERNASRTTCVPVQQCTTGPSGKSCKTVQSCTTTLGGINNTKVDDRLQSFKEKVAQHERNIEAIQSELARIR